MTAKDEILSGGIEGGLSVYVEQGPFLRSGYGRGQGIIKTSRPVFVVDEEKWQEYRRRGCAGIESDEYCTFVRLPGSFDSHVRGGAYAPVDHYNVRYILHIEELG